MTHNAACTLGARWQRFATAAVGALACLSLCACVTETVSPGASRGVSVRPMKPVGATPSARVAMPDGPIAAPASEARSLTSAVRVAIAPIGGVPFDGQTLPVVSLDGRFLATQTGDAPTWPTILAQPGAALPLRTEIEVYDLTHSPPVRVSLTDTLPPGLLLAGAADDSGFLIESPRPDGARWIGKVRWIRGGVEWIVRGEGVSTGPSMFGAGPNGIVLYTTRAASGGLAQVASTSRDMERDGNIGFIRPQLSPSGRRFVVFALAEMGLEARVYDGAGVSDVRGSGGAGTSAPLRLIARRPLHPSSDPMLAFQAATPTQMFPAQVNEGFPDGALFFHPAAGRVMFMELETGRMVALEEESISACWMKDAAGGGVLLTTPQGLVAQRLVRTNEGYEATASMRLLAEPWAPRATTNPERPFILIGPGPANDARRLTIAAMSILAPESE